jgi:hypothetical protein
MFKKTKFFKTYYCWEWVVSDYTAPGTLAHILLLLNRKLWDKRIKDTQTTMRSLIFWDFWSHSELATGRLIFSDFSYNNESCIQYYGDNYVQYVLCFACCIIVYVCVGGLSKFRGDDKISLYMWWMDLCSSNMQFATECYTWFHTKRFRAYKCEYNSEWFYLERTIQFR